MIQLSRLPLTRVIPPEQHILKQGEAGEDLYMLVYGCVTVEVAGRYVGESKAPCCFGELGFLEAQKYRTATVISRSFCIVRVLHRLAFQTIMQQTKTTLSTYSVAEMLKFRNVDASKSDQKGMIMRVSIFRQSGCSEDF